MTTPKDQTPETQPKVELTPEQQRQVDIGRALMKKVEETFKALAKT